MNILMVSFDLSGASLIYHLQKEGHSVRLFIDEENQKQNYEGMVEKVADWKKELGWVGKDGLTIFDSCGYGKEQDDLRKQGFSVVGGSELGDKLEHDRQYGQRIFSECGIPIVKSQSFKSVKEAIEFVKNNQGPWVIKQNGHADKIFNYVGSLKDGRDVIDVLNNYAEYEKDECSVIDLQKRIKGVEIGVARYFNGNDWVGPIEINLEHKDLFAGNLGPKTFEMGTLMWLDDDEKNKLFQATLAKMKDYLKSIDFRGDIDINCIINGQELYPLEVTTRFGWPATHLHNELIISPMGEFLKAVADGKQYDLKFRREFGIVVLVATPPFPYQIRTKKYSSFGEKIYFKPEMTNADFEHVHFEDVSRDKNGQHYISSNSGFVLHVTSFGETVDEARKKGLGIISKIVIPKKFYRNDIGVKFIQVDGKDLKKWGWISEVKKRSSKNFLNYFGNFLKIDENSKKEL
jgi:phosphoribosylamine---glycine ligase